MTKNELIEELQKVEGNPQISIGIDTVWGKQSFVASGITPLYQHDNHKVDSDACILEINCEDKRKLSDEQIKEMRRNYLIRRYGLLMGIIRYLVKG